MSAPTQDDLALARALVARGMLTTPEVQERLQRAAAGGGTLRALLEGEGWGMALQALGPVAPTAPVAAPAGPPAAGRVARTERATRAPFPGQAPVATAALGQSGPAAPAGGAARLGRFELFEVLGRGGFGTVYRARDTERGGEVALKLLMSLDDRQRRRFGREARATARLAHPGLAALIDAGEEQGLPWLALELVRGPSLADLARTGLPPQEAARIVRDAARAVAHAHGQGVLHRDLKPHHVLVEPSGAVKLIDFGLAFLVDGRTQLTRTGAPLGTPAYMSPEQVDPERRGGKPIDARADVWGLGATLYHALTGRAPFSAPGPELLLAAVVEEDPEPPSRWAAGVPPELDAVCLRALQKDPRRRYPGAAALADDLDRFLRGEPVQAARGRSGRARGLLLAASGAALVVATTALAVRAWRRSGDAPPGPLAAAPLAPRARDPAAPPETAETRARRVRVQALLERARREPLGLEVASAVAEIQANACPGAAGVLIEAVQRASAVLRQAGREALLEATPDGERAALEAALAARDAAPLARPLDPHIRVALDAAAARLVVPAAADRPARRGRSALAARQGDALGDGPALELRLASEALGTVGAATPVAAVEALAGYLAVEADEVRAGPAGKALIELGTDDAVLAALGAAARAIPEGTLETRLRRDLARHPLDPPLLEPSARGHLFRAQQRRALGRLTEAVADCDEALRRAPELAEAWALRGTLELERKEARRAVQDLDRALALRPDQAVWLARRGDARRQQRPPDALGAWNDLRQAENLAPEDPTVRLIVGSGLDEGPAAEATADSADAWSMRSARRHEQGDWKGALEAADKAIALDPDHAVAWSNRAAARRELGDARGAVDDLTRAVSLDGQNGGTWANLAALRYQTGDLQGGLSACDQALRLDPRLESALATRGVIRHHLGDPRGALADLGAAIQLAPWKATYWANRAALRNNAGDLAGALEDATRAVELDAKDAVAWNTLANAMKSQGRLSEGLAALDKAVELAPREATFRENRGETRARLGDLKGAHEDYDAAIQLEPDRAEHWALRGASFQAQGRLDLALRDYDRAVELAPADAAHRSRRGVIRLQAGDLAGAVQDTDQAIQADPRHGLSWMRRAVVKQAQGDLPGAVEDAGRALELEPALVDGWAMRGNWRLNLGDAGGVDDLRHFLELAPDHAQAGAVRALLEQLQRRAGPGR